MVKKRLFRNLEHDNEAMHVGDDGKKKPKAESGLVATETVSPQQNKVAEIVIADGKGLQNGVEKAACGISKSEPLLTCEFICGSFRRKLDEIWSILMMKNVSKVGVYGMGGVGKSELAKCIYNKFLEDSSYGDVCWVTVSPNLSIPKLQSAIAKGVNLNLSDEEDVDIRAAKLLRNLTAKKNFVIILDDVWSYIPLRAVGIPDSLDGCKLLLTTRSLDVCQMMECQHDVKVYCLRDGEDWELFNNELGTKTTKSSFYEEVEEIAKSIVERCGGLPLMILSMARRMRTAHFSPGEWRSSLEEMKGSKFTGHMEVFHKLKLSYDRLEDQSLQQCLLYFALFVKLSNFCAVEDKKHLIEHMIVERIVDVMSSRQAKLDRGDVLLDKLHRAGLIEYNNVCSMHELVRKMAFRIMNESFPSIVEIGDRINYQPDGHPMEDVVRVSLTNRDFTALHSFNFPMDSSVTTLLLHQNKKLESLVGAFFDRFQRLRVLNLSGSPIVRLPNSVSSLEALRALFLGSCRKLKDIPSLAKLKLLEVLDLNDCEEVKEMPDGVELLCNLTYLNFLCSGIIELRAGMFRRLINLEYLAFNWPSAAISPKDLANLDKLEFLVWSFYDVGELYAYLHENPRCSLVKYFLYVGNPDVIFTNSMDEEPRGREVFLCNCSISRTLLIQKGIQRLTFRELSIDDGAGGLCLLNAVGVTSSEIEVQSVDIRHSDDMEYLFNVWSSPSILGNVEIVEIGHLDRLINLFGRERENRVPPLTTERIPDVDTFSNLRTFVIEGCNAMKKLFPPGLLINLKNLFEMSVVECSEMEEIFAAPEEETTDIGSHSNINQNVQLSLPKLMYLTLEDLPNLKSICSAQIKCDSLISVTILKCEKIEHIPISLPLPSKHLVEVSPKSWWKSVHWGLPEEKDALKCKFT